MTSPPDIFDAAHASIWQRDLPLIKAMGANAVRVYNWDAGLHSSDSSFLDFCASIGLSVILGVSNYYLDDLPQVANLVASAYAHPALLMWSVSNEVAFDPNDPSAAADNARVAELVKRVRSAEAQLGSSHPIAVAVTCDTAHIGALEAALEAAGAIGAIDVFGFNCYWATRATACPSHKRTAALKDRPVAIALSNQCTHWCAVCCACATQVKRIPSTFTTSLRA